MSFILPQTSTKKTLSKMINGRLMYTQVAPNQVAAQEALGFTLSQIDMTRDPENRYKFKFRKIFAPEPV